MVRTTEGAKEAGKIARRGSQPDCLSPRSRCARSRLQSAAQRPPTSPSILHPWLPPPAPARPRLLSCGVVAFVATGAAAQLLPGAHAAGGTPRRSAPTPPAPLPVPGNIIHNNNAMHTTTTGHGGTDTHHRLAVRAADGGVLAVSAGVARPPGYTKIAVPPWPWVAIAPAAVAKFKYPAECVAHKCPGHLYKGPLYYSLSTVGTLPAELHPALKTHLREHQGDLALLAPHGLATDPPPPQHLAPNAKPGIWLHDLPALATLRRTIAAVDAGTTPAGMAMAGVAQSGHGAYRAHVASGVGTSQEGEAMILLSYVRRLAEQPGVYWLVPDSEAAVGPPYLPRGGPLWGWHTPPVCHSPWGPPPLPRLGHQCGPHAVALDHGPQRPHRCSDARVTGSRPHMAPPPSLLLSPPSGLPGPVPAFPHSAGRLVAGSSLHSGTGRI